MKVTVTFDSLQELLRYMNIPALENVEAAKNEEPAELPKDTPVPFEEAPKAPKTRKKSPEPAEAPQEAPEEPTEAKSPGELRVEARKVLSLLNKKTGTNTASQMIRELGVEKLTEVKDEDLPELLEKAKEALDA